MRAGARYAREALAEPREGTILTVLHDVGSELGTLTDAGLADFRNVVRRALLRGQRSLELTREQLDVLTRANVVDAGAAGFVILLEGIADYLDTGELHESDAVPGMLHDEPDAAGGEANLEHRWCTECMVSGEAVELRRLRERLAAIGSSLVVAGTRRKVRVHVHAADSREVFRIAAEFGLVSGEKADDIQRQQQAALHAARRRVAVVTDSAADIPEEELERLDIHVVPVRVHFGEHSYLDKISLGPEEFYRLLATSPVHPKTSQPPAGDFRRVFEFLASHYAQVISINVSGRISGTRQAAESAAGRVTARNRVAVIDSANAAAGEGLLVIHAAECAEAGLDAAAVTRSVLAMRARTRTFACLATLDYGVRGGRVPAIARTIANLLHLSPLLATFPNGRVAIGGILCGRSNLTAKFARFLARRVDPTVKYKVIVSHADAPAEGQRLLELLTRDCPNIGPVWLIPLGTAIGVHGGPGTLVVGLQEYSPAPAGPQ